MADTASKPEGFGPRLVRLMERRRWTVRTLANALGVSGRRIQDWKHQNSWPPKGIEFWEELAVLLGCTIEDIAPPDLLKEGGETMNLTRLPKFNNVNQDSQYLDLALADMRDFLTKLVESAKELQTRLDRIERATRGRKGRE